MFFFFFLTRNRPHINLVNIWHCQLHFKNLPWALTVFIHLVVTWKPQKTTQERTRSSSKFGKYARRCHRRYLPVIPTLIWTYTSSSNTLVALYFCPFNVDVTVYLSILFNFSFLMPSLSQLSVFAVEHICQWYVIRTLFHSHNGIMIKIIQYCITLCIRDPDPLYTECSIKVLNGQNKEDAFHLGSQTPPNVYFLDVGVFFDRCYRQRLQTVRTVRRMRKQTFWSFCFVTVSPGLCWCLMCSCPFRSTRRWLSAVFSKFFTVSFGFFLKGALILFVHV